MGFSFQNRLSVKIEKVNTPKVISVNIIIIEKFQKLLLKKVTKIRHIMSH